MLVRGDDALRQYRNALRNFIKDSVTPQVNAWEGERRVPRSLFEALGELGALGATLSQAYGGGGLPFRYTLVLVEELVWGASVGVAVSVLAHCEFATKSIDRFGTEDLKKRFLPDAIAGKRIGCLAVTEPNTGSDVASIQTRAERAGDGYVIHGAKTFISNGGFADFAVVAARTGAAGHRGISLLVVPAETPGFAASRTLEKTGTHASDTAELVLVNCRVPSENLLGSEGDGFRQIMIGFEGERLVLATMICAHMRAMWEEAREYGKNRTAFGRPLLDFQVWQHRLADAVTTIEAAEALTRRALKLYEGGQECNTEISMAKLFAAEAVPKVAHECAQIFGGYGYMNEYRISRLVRDSLAFSVGAGTSEMMREIIAKSTGLIPEREG